MVLISLLIVSNLVIDDSNLKVLANSGLNGVAILIR